MSFSFRPIVSQKSLVGMRLCNSMNWNSISLVLFGHRTLRIRYASSQLNVPSSSK